MLTRVHFLAFVKTCRIRGQCGREARLNEVGLSVASEIYVTPAQLEASRSPPHIRFQPECLNTNTSPHLHPPRFSPTISIHTTQSESTALHTIAYTELLAFLSPL